MATYNNRYQSGGNPPPTVPTYNGGGGGQPPRRRQSGWAGNLPGVNGNAGTVNTPGSPTHMDAGGPPGQKYVADEFAVNFDNDASTGTGPVTPPPPGGGEEQGPPDGYDPDELAAMITQLFGDQLGQGPRDTTEDEELIRQMMAGQVGGNLADLNARMGGMGFGDSGAAMNLSGDIYQRGARQASEDIMGLRQRSRDDYQDQIAQAAQILAGERQLGMSEDYYSAIQAYINSLMGGDDDGTIPPGATNISHNEAGDPTTANNEQVKEIEGITVNDPMNPFDNENYNVAGAGELGLDPDSEFYAVTDASSLPGSAEPLIGLNGQPGLDASGNPIYVDTSTNPHTYYVVYGS